MSGRIDCQEVDCSSSAVGRTMYDISLPLSRRNLGVRISLGLGGPGATGRDIGDGGHSGASNILLLNREKASAMPCKTREPQGYCGAGACSNSNPSTDGTSDTTYLNRFVVKSTSEDGLMRRLRDARKASDASVLLTEND